ncbi:MAG TPA: ABC transporter ATP-binding protein [Trebonia sp.]|nr:ABC transporter ATP-binding protein [Trebonia sp.]
MSPSTPIVRVQDLNIKVRDGSGWTHLVRDVSYAVDPGACLAIVGESGAGKSITVRAVLGLLDERKFQVTGTVWLGGAELGALRPAARRAHVTSHASLVFQDPSRSLNPIMRVGPQITETLLKGSGRRDKLTRAQARERSIDLMRAVGIGAPEKRYHAYPHELSGGMKQRIVIAIALACGSEVIFCDEPTSALDVTTQAQIMDLLDELRATRGITTIVITHDLALAASRAQQVLVMYAGQVVEALPAADMAASARMPYTEALIYAAPDPDAQDGLPRPIEGRPPDPRVPLPGCPFQPRCRYAAADCADRSPQLTLVADNHSLRCWHPLPLAAGSALEATRAHD